MRAAQTSHWASEWCGDIMGCADLTAVDVDAKVDAPGARGPEASVREERMVLMVLLMLVGVACCELRVGTKGDGVICIS